MGLAFALLSSYPVDGLSAPYQTAILTGGMVYTVSWFLYCVVSCSNILRTMWLTGNRPVYIDDLKVDVFEPNR